MERGTYVYCLVAAERPPSLTRAPKGPLGLGPTRLLAISTAIDSRRRARALKQWLIVADAPLRQFNEAAINARISNLDWVSRAAMAHEAVIESVNGAAAVLPMKLFTIFRNDERAVGDVVTRRRDIDRAVKRVFDRDEWGVRVILNRARATAGGTRPRRSAARPGAAYLMQKQLQQRASAELADRSRMTVDGLYRQLTRRADAARRRSGRDLPIEGGPLLLDAVFLVRRARTPRFRAFVGRRARALQGKGYIVSLSGPWPPYSFL